MNRGLFEDGGSLLRESISDINFVYDTNMKVYPTLSSDIPKLYKIPNLLGR
jgi:hypothetical protein